MQWQQQCGAQYMPFRLILIDIYGSLAKFNL